jgi:hypothetical protein
MHDGDFAADARHDERLPPTLAINVEGRDYKVDPDNGRVTIGREPPAQIHVTTLQSRAPTSVSNRPLTAGV